MNLITRSVPSMDIEYKKAYKKLREIKELMQKKSVSIEEQNKINMEPHYLQIVKQRTKLTLDMLPDDLLQYIYSFIPYYDRNRGFKNKYNMDDLQQKITAFPQKRNSLTILYHMAVSCHMILSCYYPDGSPELNYNYLENTEYHYENLNSKKRPTKDDILSIKHRFHNVILLCLKTYTKIYSKKLGADLYLKYEKIIFNIYAKIILQPTKKPAVQLLTNHPKSRPTKKRPTNQKTTNQKTTNQ